MPLIRLIGLTLLGFVVTALGACQTLYETLTTVQTPASIVEISGPAHSVVGQPVSIDVNVYVGPNGCYSLAGVDAKLDEAAHHVTVSATSNLRTGGMCSQAIVGKRASVTFTPKEPGTYRVQAERFKSYADATASSTLDVVVTAP